MTTLEREHIVDPGTAADPPVFVARDGRRARVLRLVAGAVVVLAVLWLVSLAAGMLGFSRLPGISTPIGRLGGAKPDKPRADRDTPPSFRSEQRAPRQTDETARGRPRSSQSGPVARTGARAPARPATRRPRTPLPPGTAKPVQPQPAPAPRQQGWARHGWPAAPGFVRRTAPQPPPPPGQATAPGQAKKALTPPPPPPPPPGNGNGGGSKNP